MLEIANLRKSYGSTVALTGVSLQVRGGEIVGFVGANGAGKSTTLRMLLGLTRPTSGTATIDGLPYVGLPDPGHTVGALTDPNVFHPGRTGRNALRVLARPSGIDDHRVDELLELVDLTGSARRRVGGYSTGMRQRLGLAAALLGDPATLVLDEPANGLDPVGISWLRGLLRGLADQGRTLLISSHQLAELTQTVDDVILIDHGRLIARGSTADLMARHGSASLEQLFLDLVSKGAAS
jgi:ABC-2 type transport system ATP-binding protein